MRMVSNVAEFSLIGSILCRSIVLLAFGVLEKSDFHISTT